MTARTRLDPAEAVTDTTEKYRFVTAGHNGHQAGAGDQLTLSPQASLSEVTFSKISGPKKIQFQIKLQV